MTIRLDSFGQLRHGFTKQVDNTAAVVLTILFPVHVLQKLRSGFYTAKESKFCSKM